MFSLFYDHDPINNLKIVVIWVIFVVSSGNVERSAEKAWSRTGEKMCEKMGCRQITN